MIARCRICGGLVLAGERAGGEPLHRECLDGLPVHDDDDDGADGGLAAAACHFCGAATSDGLMVFPRSGDVWPVCAWCMRLAFRRNPARPVLTYARSPN